jgi:protein N-terminal methyltransferase
MGDFYQQGMEEFEFKKKYDTIWIQWVIGYLTDNDLLTFLNKCKHNLNHNGVVVIKDNASDQYGFFLDKSDCSIVRNVRYYHAIFNHAGYDVLLCEKFKEFPDDAMPIMKFVIRPRA